MRSWRDMLESAEEPSNCCVKVKAEYTREGRHRELQFAYSRVIRLKIKRGRGKKNGSQN